MLKKTLALLGLTLSLSANAVIVNTLGGKEYQWLELSHTQGLSRTQVELRLQDERRAKTWFAWANFMVLLILLFYDIVI